MTAPAADPATHTTTPAEQPAATETATTETPAAKTDETDWKAQSRKHETRAQQHKAAADKAAADLKAVLDAIATATGQKPADVDPAKLTAELAQARTAARTTQVELAVHRAAGKLGIDGDALLDSRAFAKAAEALDPDADDFAKQVEAAVKDAAKGNPRLKTSTGPAQSGGDFTGSPGTGTPITEAQLQKMTPEAIAKALDKGELAHLL